MNSINHQYLYLLFISLLSGSERSLLSDGLRPSNKCYLVGLAKKEQRVQLNPNWLDHRLDLPHWPMKPKSMSFPIPLPPSPFCYDPDLSVADYLVSIKLVKEYGKVVLKIM